MCFPWGIARGREKSYSLIMLARLILLFIFVVLAELYILIEIGSYIGGFNTMLLVIMTAVLGVWLARLQGLRTLQQIKLSLSQGQIPAEELIDGVLILIGGILFVDARRAYRSIRAGFAVSHAADILQALAAAGASTAGGHPGMSGFNITEAASEASVAQPL